MKINKTMLKEIAHKILLKLPPEIAHKLGKWAMKHNFSAPGSYISKTPTDLFDVPINNPLGLAAGFDKNGELPPVIKNYGFGWVEVGSITYHGGIGNSKPRLFRIGNNSLLNRMGLNGNPAEEVAERLKQYDQTTFAVNIAKTHNASILGDKGIEDIVKTYRLVKKLGIYTCINISCPNTKEGKTFEEPEPLKELLQALHKTGIGKPLLIKLSPTHTEKSLDSLVEAAETLVNGYITTNTLPSMNHSTIQQTYGNGGISGQILKPWSLNIIEKLRKRTTKPIIGCGGIYTAEYAENVLNAGANYLQAYTGFIYGGPHWAHSLVKEIDHDN